MEETLKEEGEREIVHENIGNFSLPASQQQGPLLSFGQNIVNKGDFQFYNFFGSVQGKNRKIGNITPGFLYGLSDKSSLFVYMPVVVTNHSDNPLYKWIQDLNIEFEWALYDHVEPTFETQITIVTNMTLPTGSAFSYPAQGLGVPGFFLGLTAGYMDINWFYFASPGFLFSPANKGNKIGDSFLYQCGLGRNIAYVRDKWIFSWLFEFDGLYQRKSRVNGCLDHNSGGNEIICGGSLWFSTQRLILQAGASWVIEQHLFGQQPKNHYLFAFNFGWKF